MRTMNIGKLNKRVTILKLGDKEDEMGQITKGLVELKTVWGTLYPVRGSEFYEIQKIEGKVTHKCYIRFLAGVDNNCFLRHRGKTFTVESVIDVDLEHKMLEIHCSERINSEAVDDV